MSDSLNNTSKLRIKLFHVFFIPMLTTLFILLSFLLEWGMEWDFSKGGVLPRHPERLWTIFTYIFVHANWGHLVNNILSFFLLSASLFYFYRPVGLQVFGLLWLISGFILWLVGRADLHVGASGLIYAMAAFLFLSGLIRRHIPLIAISLVVTILYGNMVWHIFPWQVNDPVSWEGHLSGLFTGLLLAVAYRNSGPQRPVKVWDEEEEDNDFWNEKGLDDAEPESSKQS